MSNDKWSSRLGLLMGIAVLGAATPALGGEADLPDDVALQVRRGWAGVGLSAAGSTLYTVGAFALYDGPVDALNRHTLGGRDVHYREPQSAILSGVVLNGGLGLSSVGRPLASIGSLAAARKMGAAGGSVSPALGWLSVGAWGAGVGTYVGWAAQGSTAGQWTWIGLRGVSFGAAIGQLVLVQNAATAVAGRQPVGSEGARPKVEIGWSLSPTGIGAAGHF